MRSREYAALSPEDRKALVRQEAARWAVRNDESRAAATHSGAAWTELEDRFLCDTLLSILETAAVLGRSYGSIVARRAFLFSLGDSRPHYSGAPTANASLHHGRARVFAVLCPCGTTDGDHDSWCPVSTEP